ncbi:hypothetical protein PISMIDRAFT_678036 [Pisolithus microcarpus 441]|uniref:Uncharacterized protein n=1 Tax=Pisolithus microcarpus 441 TaxID=765257 RepID=A0A0C9ZQQ7_9AGAM|nr:hypothetical protein PISMIDRAFT_678036 [Pisolithus microcarpus 441]
MIGEKNSIHLHKILWAVMVLANLPSRCMWLPPMPGLIARGEDGKYWDGQIFAATHEHDV